MLGKVLVADDNLNIQKLVTAALKPEDIEVVAVGHGEAAVRKIPEVNPDLILADVFMPVRTGYEVCEFVKKDPNLAHIPVVLLVGAFEPLDQKEVGRVHADGFLKKPFESAQLVSTVKGYLSKIQRKPTREMQEAAQEFAATIPVEETGAEELAPTEQFSTRPEPVQYEGTEAEKPLAFSDMLGEAAPFAASVQGEQVAEEPAAPAGFAPPAFEGAAIPAEFAAGEEPPPAEAILAEPAPVPEIFAEPAAGGPTPETVEPAPAELGAPALEFAQFEAAVEAAPVEATTAEAPPTFEAAPAFEAPPELETPPAFEPAPTLEALPAEAAPPIPEELVIQKEEQPWEIRAPIGARDPMLAESVTDFMAAPQEVKLPETKAWEPSDVAVVSEEALAQFTPETVPAEAPTAPQVDEALVEAVVQQVMERLTPQIVETVARELVRPLAESLLKEKLEQ